MHFIRIAFLLLVCSVGLTANAAGREEIRVGDAADVLDQFLRIPEQAIPPTILARAYAVAVIPNVVKVGFGLGARHGRGILVIRRDDNTWSNPAFVALSGGSIGWQVGAQSTDIILVFKTRKGVDGISDGKLTLGADASIAAGPVGRQASAATDLQFQAEVVSYSRNRGLFAGVSFEGSGVTMDRKANAAFYGNPAITPEQIFAAAPQIAPDSAKQFVNLLTEQTRQLPTQPSLQDGDAPGTQGTPATTGANPRDDMPAESDVKTFGMPDPDAAEPPDDGF